MEARSKYEDGLVQDFAHGNNYVFVVATFRSQLSWMRHRLLQTNTFFHSTFSKSDFSLPAMGEIPVPDSTLPNVSFSADDVYDILISLDAMGRYRP